MQAQATTITDVLLFIPEPSHDRRGLFTRTFDATVAVQHGVDVSSFVQDSQSRSWQGVIRGLHGRSGRGEAKLVRCARGAVFDVVVDARPSSPTFGQQASFLLDDEDFRHLYVPPGMLHGFQVLTDIADVCYRIDRVHDRSEDLGVRYDDPDLAIPWPRPVTAVSDRDADSGSWSALCEVLS